MKKLVALTFLMAFVFVSYAGNEKPEIPKVTNYMQVLKQIEYPQNCLENGIEGKVVVSLSIDKMGNVTGYRFRSSPSNDLSDAVEKVLPKMKFKPATNKNGETIPGKIILPIDFKLTI